MATESENLLNSKTELTSEEKFKLLVLDVPYNSAVAQPPLVPDKSQNVLVDKIEAGVDWLHTTVGSWRQKSTNMRLFRKNDSTDIGWVHRKLSLAEYKTVSGNGYILKTQYSHHNSEKYASVKRHSTEVLKLFPGKPAEPTTYGLIQYNFPSEISSISPNKRKGQPFIPTAPSCKRKIQEAVKDPVGPRSITSQLSGNILDHDVPGLIDVGRDDFENQFIKISKMWPSDFREYFKKCVKEDMKTGMLRDVRKSIGLGQEFFYNNGLECLNKKIKTKKRESQLKNSSGPPISKPCSLFEAVKIYDDLIFEERLYINQAMIGIGPYVLSDAYQHLQVDQREFCSKNMEEKRQILGQTDAFMKSGYTQSGDIFTLGNE